MKFRYAVASAAMFAMLAACGGGGSGGIASTPTPAPSPTPTPTATNTSFANLTRNQSFTTDSAELTGTWDLTSSTVIDGSAAKATVAISYDAGTGSYTVGLGNRNVTFGGADVSSQDNVQTIYTKTDATGTDHLTLVSQPYAGTALPQYVRMGYWQRNSVAGSSQDTDFSTFTYGFPTAAAAVPRTGSAAYAIDAFALVTAPGEEPSTLQGSGHLSVDFAQGIFSAQADFEQHGLVTGSSGSGGGLELRSGGHLGSDGTFSGNAVVGSLFGQGSGKLDGRFYGPGASEVGATFSAVNNGGLAAVGSFVGQNDATFTPIGQTLLDSRYPKTFYAHYGQYLVGSLNWLNAETFDFGAPISDMGGGRFTISDKVASGQPNFTTYKKHVTDTGYGDQDVVLDLYNPGAGNTELALTYASFGHWAGTRAGVTQDSYFAYGYTTGQDFLTAKTGTAHYQGVAYGSGLSSDGSAAFDVKGTSSFDVDFGQASFTGTLALLGTQRDNGRGVDFGQFALAGSEEGRGAILTGAQPAGGGSFFAQFFGPDAEELGGTYYVIAPHAVDGKDVGIQGAVAATKR